MNDDEIKNDDLLDDKSTEAVYKKAAEDSAALPNETDEREEKDSEMSLNADDENHSDYRPVNRFDASVVHHLSGMYQSWFLDYASYVILERAVPHIEDGLKPVQRRILHSMKRMDDGRYNKVANIVGHTMQFHPHGDASIGDALVQMGQKDLLIDTQGNWGNILTGDRAAASRYIEARLSKFALDVVFNPKTTLWQASYDGRNKEPITLPVKFPLLLAQGAEGIAVGLSSKILPHNFVELCDAAIAYLKGKPFQLFPDFPTGGSIDVSKYNEGQRGGSVKVRAKIEKLDSKTLVIRELPFSKNTTTLIDSILKAIEKGKIKVKKVDDNTSAEVEILIHLAPGVSSDKTLDALYAFSDCEINISPNCCVIENNKPVFLTVTDVLKHSADHTKELLRQELQIRRGELLEQLFFASLERIFIEKRIYKEKSFETAVNLEAVVAFVDSKLEPFKKNFIREVTREDILRLLEIKMQRILKFNKDKADELIAKIETEIKGIDHDLAHIVDVAVAWYKFLKDKYGKDYPRKTEIRNFDTIEAAKVVEDNEKLYINRSEGFLGTSLRKDEFICNCSDIDDIIVFYRDGHYRVVKVAEKLFVGKGVIHVQVFKRNDKRTIYNMIYREGKDGPYYIKRFYITSSLRDRDVDLTKGVPHSRVYYFTANPNGEAEVVKVSLEANRRLRTLTFDYDFKNCAIRGKASKGILLTKNPVSKIGLKSKGHSTLGGRKVWFDPDVNRINYQEHGRYLGEFNDGDTILVILDTYECYNTNFDANNHYEHNILHIEKFDAEKVWSAVVKDADYKGAPYLKRFTMEGGKKRQNIAGDNPKSKVLWLSDVAYPRINLSFSGKDAANGDEIVDVESFTVVRSFKAHGRKLTDKKLDKIQELDPIRFPETEEEPEEDESVDNVSAIETAVDGEKMANTATGRTPQRDLFGDFENSDVDE